MFNAKRSLCCVGNFRKFNDDDNNEMPTDTNIRQRETGGIMSLATVVYCIQAWLKKIRHVE